MRRRIWAGLCLVLCGTGLPAQEGRDGWVLEARDFEPYYGITAANGTLGLVSSAEPFKCSQVVLADVYDEFGRGRVSNFLPEVDPIEVDVYLDGAKVTRRGARDYVQRMDLATGTFSGDLSFRDHQVRYTLRALRQLPHAALLEVTVTAGKACTLRVDNVHALPSSLHDAAMTARTLTFPRTRHRLDLITTAASSPTGRVRTVASSAFIGLEAPMHVIPDADRHYQTVTRTLAAGETFTFQVVGALISDAQVADPLNQAERIVTYACLQGVPELSRRHEEAWAHLWESDIRIEGDPDSQREVRAMLYHLYAFNRMDGAFSPSPMGLSGLGYNGHVFWDTEIFMFPTLLALRPEMARTMLQYRFERLDQARRNAASYGFAGAMFPWESAATGAEECPVTSLSGTFQHHVTADVGIAAWNYYRVTRDRDWLAAVGWPLLKDIAAFWASRVEHAGGTYHVRNVMCADEWALNVDDDAYTNGAVRRVLEAATAAAKVLKEPAPAVWADIAANLRFETFEGGVTREHAAYDGADIKQADVNLLAWPLGLTEGDQALRDLDYYAQKVPQRRTPAMTQAMFSVISARYGTPEDAWRWFVDAWRPNGCPPFGVLAEFKGGTNPYFLTGAGGALQAVLYGFAGLDITDRGLVQRRGVLPPAWTALTVTTPSGTFTVR